MADINDWVDEPSPAAALPSAGAHPSNAISDWVDDAPTPSFSGDFKDSLASRMASKGIPAMARGDNPISLGLELAGGVGAGAAYDATGKAIDRGAKNIADKVDATPTGKWVGDKLMDAEYTTKAGGKSAADYIDPTGSGRKWVGDKAKEGIGAVSDFVKNNPTLAGTVEGAVNLLPIDDMAKIPYAAMDAAKSTGRFAKDVAEDLRAPIERDPIPPSAAEVASKSQKERNISYVEARNAYAENVKESYAPIYSKAGEISSGVEINAPKMKSNVDALVDNLNEDTVHKTSQGSSQAFRDLQAVADSFDESGNIPLDKVTLLKRRLNDLYGSDMGDTRSEIYGRLNTQLNELIKRAKKDNPEWGTLMDSGNALFNNYRSTFDSPGLSNKSWSLADKKEYEDAYRARHGDPSTDMPGDPYSAPASDETRNKIFDFHKVDNVAHFESMVRTLPPEMRDQFTKDVIAYSKEKNPRLANAIGAVYSASNGNLGTALVKTAKILKPGEPGFNPNLAESFPHVEDAITHHTNVANDAYDKYMDKLYNVQNPPSPLALPAPATRLPADQSGLYRKLPAPDPTDPRFPMVNETAKFFGQPLRGPMRHMTQDELENYIAHQQKMSPDISTGERAAQHDRKTTIESDRIARARKAYKENSANASSDFSDESDKLIKNYPEDVPPFLKDKFARGGAAKHIVDVAPTDAQKAAGNYKKAHVRIHGLDISIENPRGSHRSGTGKDGKKWKSMMPDHYGYIRKTEGADGDHVDVYLGDNIKSKRIYVIDQKDSETGKFDEHKCMIGYEDRDAAVRAYKSAFSDKKDRIMKVTRLSIHEFKDWLKNGNTKKPVQKAA